MRPDFIKAHITSVYGTLSRFARHLEVSPQAVTNVIYGLNRSRRIEQAIAALIGQPIHIVFPNWYSAPAEHQ